MLKSHDCHFISFSFCKIIYIFLISSCHTNFDHLSSFWNIKTTEMRRLFETHRFTKVTDLYLLCLKEILIVGYGFYYQGKMW